MTIRDIDHVEFYVDDAARSAAEMCDGYGFTVRAVAGPETGQPDHRSILVRQGDVRLVFTAGLTPEHPARRYVARHGDGVACVAMAVDDVPAEYDALVRRGATSILEPTTLTEGAAVVTIAEVSGIEDLRHRLVRRRGGESFLPGVLVMRDAPDAEETALLDRVDHVAVCLPAGSLDGTVDFYRTVFDFEQIFEEYVEVGRQAMNSKVVQSRSGGVTFTLIEPDPTREPGQIDQFLDAHAGAGVQHLAYLTGNITATVRTFERRGVAFLGTPAAYYDVLAERLGHTEVEVDVLREVNVLVDRDHWGEVFQIFARSTHPRGTYFSEIIDRHGARTFGSGNIKALYQAVSQADESAATATAGAER